MRNMKREDLRKVEVFKPECYEEVQVYGGIYKKAIGRKHFGYGYFHKWVTLSFGDEEGNETKLYGVVEDEEGFVKRYEPDYIKFID